MADRQTKIQIPERLDDEAPATAEQLQLIRQLVTGLSLQGYRFDYRKLGTKQAAIIIDQLLAIQGQQRPTAKPRKQGPGCIASFAKGTTALIVWAVVLAAVAGGAYLIYWQIRQAPATDGPQLADSTDDPAEPRDTADSGAEGRESNIFSGLGASDDAEPPADPEPEAPDSTTPATPPAPEPDPTSPAGPGSTKQLLGVENLLVQLSQFTRNEFALDVRTLSSERMQKKLDTYPAALAALDAEDPTLSARIRAIIDAFAADQVDGPALRDEIKAIRQVIDDIQSR